MFRSRASRLSLALVAAVGCGDAGAGDEGSESSSTGIDEETSATTVTEPTGDPTTADDTSSVTASTLTASETDPTDTTGMTGCQNNTDCEAAAFPICLDSLCAPCTAAPDPGLACSMKDEGVPVCAESGSCVQCEEGNDTACGDTTPICDTGTSTCVGCTYHEQCPTTACDIATGACIDGMVVHVDGDAGCSNAGAGTEGDPFCDIQVGIDAIGAAGVVIVHAAGSYSETLSVGGGGTLAILAAGTDQPNVTSLDKGPTLSMAGAGTRLYIEGLRFSNNNSAVALSLAEGEAWLDRVQVVVNGLSGSGVEATGGANVDVRSSIIAANGSDLAPTFGLRVDDASMVVIASTIVNNDSVAANSLRCVNGGSATVRNSIVFSDEPAGGSIDCAGLTATYSVFDEAVDGEGNQVLAQTLSWFAMPASVDYRLSAAGATEFMGDALVELGDYPFDVDGDPRPAPGMMDHAGADVP